MSSKLETGARVTHTWSLSHAHAHAPTVTRTGWQSVAESILLFDAHCDSFWLFTFPLGHPGGPSQALKERPLPSFPFSRIPASVTLCIIIILVRAVKSPNLRHSASSPPLKLRSFTTAQFLSILGLQFPLFSSPLSSPAHSYISNSISFTHTN